MDQPWLVVGLGNPGDRYARNRHNAGYLVADQLAAEVGGRFSAHRSRAHVLEGRLPPSGGLPGPRIVLAKPSVFMNESGGPVSGLINFYRIPIGRLIVAHDELDLPFGVVRLKQGGGEGGHNGLRSISRSTDSKDYIRVRLGIGRPPGRMDPADYVLKDVPGADREEFQLMVSNAADAVRSILVSGFAPTQKQINSLS
jgi:peptidyl-tRNA hydrolase, PTH1 family